MSYDVIEPHVARLVSYSMNFSIQRLALSSACSFGCSRYRATPVPVAELVELLRSRIGEAGSIAT